MALQINEGGSSFSTARHMYDVFLSFRGEDTRYNFTGHLYHALCDKGFNTFIDDNLQRGEEISTELLKAIELSMILIVVFSENFASSTWCLNELVKILECKNFDQLILPVFYKVNPSEVRKQEGKFGIALTEHEEKHNKDKVQSWRAALTKATYLVGFSYKDGCFESKTQFIKKIIKEISSTTSNRTQLFVAKYPVGIDSRVEEIELLLDTKSNGVRMLGILGLGGVGKTTIAKAIYNRIFGRFDRSYFLENIREKSWTTNGIIQLQETLLSMILQDTYLKVDNVPKGIELIMDRLCHTRLLLILDDVDEWNQIENLLGSCDWFSSGSRIIITTRDKQVVTTLGKDHLVYEVKKLNQCEAHELFRLHTFQMNKPREDYSEVAKQIIHYANVSVHESIGFLDRLRKWDLKNCDSLQNLPNNLRLKSLEELNLFACPMLEKFPNIHQEMKRLKKLELSYSGIRELPSSIGYLTQLTELGLNGCHNLRDLPDSIYKLQMLEIGEILCEGERSDIFVDPRSLIGEFFGDEGEKRSFIVPITEIPRWLNSKHQSVGNSISFHVGHKFPNVFAVYFAFGLEKHPFDDFAHYALNVYLSINGFEEVWINEIVLGDDSDTLWVFSRSHLKLQKLLNESNPSDYNHIEVTYEWDLECSFELRRGGVKVECICCPQKSSILSSMALTLVDYDSDSNLNLPLKKRRKY
uniref:TIR domain-containing protein n=1 Tax=Quercus lobata TaxID=97700 RepID=A0A7N2M0U0_QUELO